MLGAYSVLPMDGFTVDEFSGTLVTVAKMIIMMAIVPIHV